MKNALRPAARHRVWPSRLLLAVLAGCAPGGGDQMPAARADSGTVDQGAPVSLLVQGRIGPDTVTIEPVFRIDTGRVPAQRAGGPHLLIGLDRDGAVLFERPFETTAVAAGPEEHYSVVVELDDPHAERLHRIEVRAADSRSAFRTASMNAEAFAQALAKKDAVWAERIADGMVRLHWDSSVFLATMVRTPHAGTVLAIGRRGEVVVLTELDTLEVVLSEGVRSGMRHVRVQ